MWPTRVGWVVIAAAFFLRIYTFAHTSIRLSGDAYFYLDKAKVFATTGKLPSLGVQPSGYPIIISSLVHRDDGLSLLSIASVQRFMDLVVICALILLAWRLLRSQAPSIKVLVAAVLLLQPFTATMASLIYTEQMVAFFTFFGVMSVALGLASLVRKQKQLLFAAGSFLMGVAGIMRPDIMLLNALVLVLAAGLGIWKLRLRHPSSLALLILPFVIAPALVVLVQYQSTGELGLVSSRHHKIGYHSWLRTWPADRKEYADFAFFDSSVHTLPFGLANATPYPEKAFSTNVERSTVVQLLKQWQQNGYDDLVDKGFKLLADERRVNQPLRYFLLNPMYRMFHFWFNIDGSQFYLVSFSLGKPWSMILVAAVALVRAVLIGLFLCGLLLSPRMLTYLSHAAGSRSQEFLFMSTFHCLSAAYVVLRTFELGFLGLFAWGGLMEVRYVIVAIPFALFVSFSGLQGVLSLVSSPSDSPRPKAIVS